MLAIVRGHQLMQYITESKTPLKFNKLGELNPKLVIWDQQGQLLLGWLLESVSHDLLPHLVGCDSSFSVWKRIEKMFASKLR